MNSNTVAGRPIRRAAPGEGVAREGHSEGLPRVRAIVLAGVHAWGDCVLEEASCRTLLPVANRPLIAHALEWIRRGVIQEATVCGNSDTARLRRALGSGDGLGLTLDYFEDVMPRGPAGCVRDAALATDADVVVVVDGTTVPCVDLEDLLQVHEQSGAAVTLVVSNDGREGDGRDSIHTPTGIYVFARQVLAHIPERGYQDIKETLIPNLYRKGVRIATYTVPASLAPRVSDAASYLEVNMWALERIGREDLALDGCERVGDAWVHRSARVHPSVRFVGPVLVGPESALDAGVLVVGPTTIGADCAIGAQAVLSRSAIWNRCRVGAGAIVDQCILADDAVVEAELAMRETACVPSRRASRRLLDRLGLSRRYAAL